MTAISWFVLAVVAGSLATAAPTVIVARRTHRRHIRAGQPCPVDCPLRRGYWTPWEDL